MLKKIKILLPFLLISLVLLAGCDRVAENTDTDTGISSSEDMSVYDSSAESDSSESTSISEDGIYTSKEDVALYIHTYGHLPDNFIMKKEAIELGWEGGSLEAVAPGKCIGGDYFGNYEGKLPDDRDYHECDIDTLYASSRGAKRIVYSDDGFIYYTQDHYESFELLYGEE